MVIRITAEQTAGALYEFDWFIHPGGAWAPHYHPTQEECFEGVAGTPHGGAGPAARRPAGGGVSRAVLVGGGIGGLTAAVVLRLAG
jgi:hypothetical protein